MQYQYQGRERSRPGGKHPTRIIPWLRFRHSGTRKLLPDGKVRGTAFFPTSTFLLCPGLCSFQNYIWPVRLISTRSSPQSRTFSCHDSRGRIDPGGVVKPFMDANPFLSPVTVLSHGGEFNKSKVK